MEVMLEVMLEGQKKALPFGEACKNMIITGMLFQVLQDDLHLARREDLAVDMAKLLLERLYPPLYCSHRHVPTAGQLQEGHRGYGGGVIH